MNESEESRQLESVETLRTEFVRIAHRDSRQRRRLRGRRAGVAVAGALIVIPGGYAIAQEVVDGGSEGVPASECPQATVLLERYGLGPFDRFIPGCPDVNELERDLIERQRDVESAFPDSAQR